MKKIFNNQSIGELITDIKRHANLQSLQTRTSLSWGDCCGFMMEEEREIVKKRFLPYLKVIIRHQCLMETGGLNMGQLCDVDDNDVFSFVELSPSFRIDGLNKKTISRARVSGEIRFTDKFYEFIGKKENKENK